MSRTLVVTPQEFCALQDAAWEAQGIDYFDEAKWEAAVHKALRLSRILESTPLPPGDYVVIVDWSVR